MPIRVETLQRYVLGLDGLIAAIAQQGILYTLSPRERATLEKLREARLCLIEEMDTATGKKIQEIQ